MTRERERFGNRTRMPEANYAQNTPTSSGVRQSDWLFPWNDCSKPLFLTFVLRREPSYIPVGISPSPFPRRQQVSDGLRVSLRLIRFPDRFPWKYVVECGLNISSRFERLK